MEEERPVDVERSGLDAMSWTRCGGSGREWIEPDGAEDASNHKKDEVSG